MHARSAPFIVAGSLALVALAGCAAPGPAAFAPSPTVEAPTPRLTPVPVPTLFIPDPTPDVPDATPAPTPIQGGVDGALDGPELSVEPVGTDAIQVTLDDPAAKAWRVVVAGTGEQTGDRWEILVETSDIEPLITATEIRDGKVVDELDLTGFGSGTAAAGGCHPALRVCLESTGFELPDDGDGRFSVRLVLAEAGVPLAIQGGTAGWPAEPFELGPWTDTAAFHWG